LSEYKTLLEQKHLQSIEDVKQQILIIDGLLADASVSDSIKVGLKDEKEKFSKLKLELENSISSNSQKLINKKRYSGINGLEEKIDNIGNIHVKLFAAIALNNLNAINLSTITGIIGITYGKKPKKDDIIADIIKKFMEVDDSDSVSTVPQYKIFRNIMIMFKTLFDLQTVKFSVLYFENFTKFLCDNFLSDASNANYLKTTPTISEDEIKNRYLTIVTVTPFVPSTKKDAKKGTVAGASAAGAVVTGAAAVAKGAAAAVAAGVSSFIKGAVVTGTAAGVPLKRKTSPAKGGFKKKNLSKTYKKKNRN
jgi:hypothetical protein